jgi:hypothetical protein
MIVTVPGDQQLSPMDRRKINRISLALLLLGFGTAVLIYLTARPEIIDPLLGDPLNNKKYRHDLELYGGKANVLSAQFMDWFGSLWHGQSLAYTIATLTVAGVLIYRFVATHPAPDFNDSVDGPAPPSGPS